MADSLSITQKMQRDDHDTLIRVETKMDQLVSDVKELKDGLTFRVSQIEMRVADLEKLRDEIQPKTAMMKLEEVYQWKHDFKLTWKVILGIVSVTSSIAGAVVSLVLRLWGW